MKNLKKVLFMCLFLLSALIVINCSSDDNNPTPVAMKVQDFNKAGEIHNLFLTNVKNEFKPLENISNIEEKIEYINDFNKKFVGSLDISPENKKALINDLEKNKNLVVESNIVNKAFGKKSSSKSTTSSDINLIDMINDLKESEQINDTSYEILSNISIDIKNNYDGSLTDSDLKLNVEKYIAQFNQAGYDISSGEGEMVGTILAISISSIEWWEENPDALLNLSKRSSSTLHNKALIAPWLAADVGGAIYGAAAGAVGSYLLNGEVSWKATGWASLAGAVGASTGAAGKIAKWIFG